MWPDLARWSPLHLGTAGSGGMSYLSTTTTISARIYLLVQPHHKAGLTLKLPLALVLLGSYFFPHLWNLNSVQAVKGSVCPQTAVSPDQLLNLKTPREVRRAISTRPQGSGSQKKKGGHRVAPQNRISDGGQQTTLKQ